MRPENLAILGSVASFFTVDLHDQRLFMALYGHCCLLSHSGFTPDSRPPARAAETADKRVEAPSRHFGFVPLGGSDSFWNHLLLVLWVDVKLHSERLQVYLHCVWLSIKIIPKHLQTQILFFASKNPILQ